MIKQLLIQNMKGKCISDSTLLYLGFVAVFQQQFGSCFHSVFGSWIGDSALAVAFAGSGSFSWELEDKLISCLKLLKRLYRGNPWRPPSRSIGLRLCLRPSMLCLCFQIWYCTHEARPDPHPPTTYYIRCILGVFLVPIFFGLHKVSVCWICLEIDAPAVETI